MKTLQKIADDLLFVLADDMSVEEYDLVAGRGAAQQVAYAFCHGACDDFAQAMHEATGWPVASVTHPGVGLMHRLVAAPDGRLLDAEGWQDAASLGKRYGKKRGLLIERLDQPGAFFSAGEDEIETALEAALQLPWEPFTEAQFKALIERRLEDLKEMDGHSEAAGPQEARDQRDGMEMMRGRAARADPAAALAILEKIPNVPPEPGDEMPNNEVPSSMRPR